MCITYLIILVAIVFFCMQHITRFMIYMNVIKSLPLYLVFSSIRIFPEDSDRGMAISTYR